MQKQRMVMVGIWAIALISAIATPSVMLWNRPAHIVSASMVPSASSRPYTAREEELIAERVTATTIERANRGTPRTVPSTSTTQVVHRTATTPHRDTHRGYASTEECIAAVENGGSYARSTNPTHFGRYQFDRNAWMTFGGSPSTWGTASPAEQDRVFANAMNQHAYSRWTPYDHC